MNDFLAMETSTLVRIKLRGVILLGIVGDGDESIKEIVELRATGVDVEPTPKSGKLAKKSLSSEKSSSANVLVRFLN